MAQSIDQSFVNQYESDVHEAFQRQGSYLLKTLRRKPNVVGATTSFPKVGKGMATTKARHGQITPMNQTHERIPCTLEDFYAGDWVDRLDEAKINHDERMVIANGGAWALGRKADDQIITAMDTTTTTVGDFSAGITRALFLETEEALNNNDVPNDGNRWLLLTPRQWAIAMTIKEFQSADWVTDFPLMGGVPTNGIARQYLSFKVMMHTGLPGVGTAQGKNFAYHYTVVGYGSAREAGNIAGNNPVAADIQWYADRASHFVNHMMSGGACLIDARGCVEVQLKDDAPIPAS